MTALSELELSLILALYYFDAGKNAETFAKRFNQYFHRDISAATILFSVSRFKNIDPSNNNTQHVPETDGYAQIWDRYISNEKTKELKELYRSFKKGSYIEKNDIEDIDDEYDANITPATPVDTPQERPENYQKGVSAYKRSAEVVANALFAAGHKCEVPGCEIELFIRKSDGTLYTEAHHLIPLCFQSNFEYSLDVEANVVSLCPSCHRMLHHGKEIYQVLKMLYEERKDRLSACGIDITFEELLLLYR